MSDNMQFTKNYSDISTNSGFQFEFFCDRCGNGFRTRFQPSSTGTAPTIMEGASSLFGGVFSSASNLTERVRSATWQKAHDAAFAKAVEELRPQFMQCPHCQSWVCRKSCWNDKRGLCKKCAPDLGVEMSAAQANKGVESVWTNAQADDEAKKVAGGDWSQTVKASCPSCGAPLATNAKFCPECGEKLQVEAKCPKCGAKVQPGAKFCAECGTKV